MFDGSEKIGGIVEQCEASLPPENPEGLPEVICGDLEEAEILPLPPQTQSSNRPLDTNPAARFQTSGLPLSLIDKAIEKPGYIFTLGRSDLEEITPTQRAALIESVLHSTGFEVEEKVTICLILLQTIPDGDNQKAEARKVLDILKEKGSLSALVTVPTGEALAAMLITLYELGAPRNLFAGTYTIDDVNAAYGQGLVEWGTKTIDGLRAIAIAQEDPTKKIVDIGKEAILTGSAYLITEAVGREYSPGFGMERMDAIDAAIDNWFELSKHAKAAAEWLGVGDIYLAEKVGNLAPDIALTALWAYGSLAKGGTVAAAALTPEALAGYTERTRSLILKLAVVPAK